MASFDHTDDDDRHLRVETDMDEVLIHCDAPGERAVSHRLTRDEWDALTAAIEQD